VRLPLGGLSSWVSAEVLRALQEAEGNRINSRRELVVQSDSHRTQNQNLEAALRRINSMLTRAAEACVEKEPDPAKVRRVRAMKRRADSNRLEDKKRTAAKKADRRRPVDY